LRVLKIKLFFYVTKFDFSNINIVLETVPNYSTNMTKLNQLKSFYDSELLANLKKLDGLRTRVIVQLIILVAAGAVIFPLMAKYLLEIVTDSIYLFMFIPVFALIALMFYVIYESVYKSTSFYKVYKRDVIYRLIKFINPTLHYDNRLSVTITDFNKSGLFDKGVAIKFDGDDHISGNIDDVKVEFSELEVEYKNAADKTARGSKYLFRGIFFVGKGPKPFPADLVVLPKNAKPKDGLTPIHTNNAAFNEFFQILLANKDEEEYALEMLNADFMESLVKLKRELLNEVYVSFVYDQIFVAIAHERNLFEPELWKSAVNFEEVLIHFKDLYYPINIIEHFAAKKEIHIGDENVDYDMKAK